LFWGVALGAGHKDFSSCTTVDAFFNKIAFGYALRAFAKK